MQAKKQKQNFYYETFGLKIRSELRFPELKSSKTPTTPDLTLARSATPRKLENPIERRERYSTKKGVLLAELGRHRRILVENGTKILLDYKTEEDLQVIRPHILGNIMACVLYLRGLTPLHAGAFVYKNQAVAICGDSGRGKSTLVAAVNSLGCDSLSDDITAIDTHRSTPPICFAGPRRAKLNRRSLELLARKPAPSYAFEPIDEKYLVDDCKWAENNHYLLKAIFELNTCDSIEEDKIKPVQGIEKIRIVERYLFKPSLAIALGKKSEQASRVFDIGTKIIAFQVTRSMKAQSHPLKLAQQILELL